MGEELTFSPAWILKDTPRTASGSSGRCLSPKSRNSIWPPRGQGARAAQAGSVQGAWGRRGHWIRGVFSSVSSSVKWAYLLLLYRVAVGHRI